MRIIIDISGIRRKYVGDQIVDDLAAIYPEGNELGGFNLRLPEDDPRAKTVLARLKELGLEAWWGERKLRPPDRSREYVVDYWREYDEADLEPAEYLRLSAPDDLNADSRDERGCVCVRTSMPGVPESAAFGYAGGGGWHFASDRCKRMLEAERLRHLLFRDTVLIDDRDVERVIPWSEFGEAWWELDSDLTLPPVSPTMTIRKIQTGEVVKPGYAGAVGFGDPVDPRVRGAELHYRRADLEKVGPFDAARSFEWAGSKDQRWFIVSNRFYLVTKQNDLKAEWVPVRIDD